MINSREKMIFASGTRQCRAQFAVAKRTAECRDSADYPKHEQREPGLNFRYLKTETREDAGADNVGDNDGTRGDETDRAPRPRRFCKTSFVDVRHRWIDNPEITGTREFFWS